MTETPPPISDDPQELDLSTRHTAAHKALRAALGDWQTAPPLSLKRRRAAGALFSAWEAVHAVRVAWVAYDPTFPLTPQSCVATVWAWCRDHDVPVPPWAALPKFRPADLVLLFDTAA